MSDLPLPPDDEMGPGALMSPDVLMGMATSLALGLITLARAALAGFAGRAFPRSAGLLILRRFVVPAEATVRRAILVVASTLPLPVPRPRAEGQTPPRNPPSTSLQSARRPVFCLTEPLRAPRKSGGPATPLPRITILDAAALQPRAPKKDPAADDRALAIALQRRLIALEEAYADPIRQARRYLRRRAREGAAATPRVPLAFFHIPGNGPHMPPRFRDVLSALNGMAMETLLPQPDSS